MGLHSTFLPVVHAVPLSTAKMSLLLSRPSVSYTAPLHPASGDGKSMSSANAIISAVLSSFTFVIMHFETNKENKLGS